MSTGHSREERLRGIILMVLSASLFAVVDGLSKILADDQSVGQIVWARYAFAIPVLIFATPTSKWPSLFKTKRLGDQIMRGAVPLVISCSMVLAVRYLPLAEATVVLYAGPFLVVALSQSFLGEHVRPAAWASVAVGFIAVLIVCRPGFSNLSVYTIFPLIGAVFYALFQVFTRRLGAAGEAPHTTLAWTLAIGSLVATPAALIFWSPVSFANWALLISLGLVFGVAQILAIRAFTHAPANLLAPFSYAQVISATIFGIMVFGALPDIWTFIGIVMIVASGAYVMRHRNS